MSNSVGNRNPFYYNKVYHINKNQCNLIAIALLFSIIPDHRVFILTANHIKSKIYAFGHTN